MRAQAITRPVILAESTILEITAALEDVSDPSRLGRARQLYGSVWEQLDLARDAAAASGCAVASYDKLRAERPEDLFAADQTAMTKNDGAAFVARVVVGLPGSPSRTQLDLSGLLCAKAAAEALRSAAPALPWQEESRQLQALEDTNVQGSNRVIARLIVVAVIALIVFLVWYGYHDTHR